MNCPRCGAAILNVDAHLEGWAQWLCSKCGAPPAPLSTKEAIAAVGESQRRNQTGVYTSGYLPAREGEEPERYCKRCEETKPVAEFRLCTRSNGSQYRECWCHECLKKYRAEWKRKHAAAEREEVASVCD